MLVHQFLQRVDQIISNSCGFFSQSVFLNRIHYCDGNGTRHWIATILKLEMHKLIGLSNFSTTKSYSVKVFNSRVSKTLSNFLSCNHSRHRMTISHGFPHCHNIRNDIFALQLKSPIMFSNSAKSDLNFIRNANASSVSNIP
jgi:hypothetical protein